MAATGIAGQTSVAGRSRQHAPRFLRPYERPDERLNLPLAKLGGKHAALRAARRSLAGIGTSAPLGVGTSETVSVPRPWGPRR